MSDPAGLSPASGTGRLPRRWHDSRNEQRVPYRQIYLIPSRYHILLWKHITDTSDPDWHICDFTHLAAICCGTSLLSPHHYACLLCWCVSGALRAVLACDRLVRVIAEVRSSPDADSICVEVSCRKFLTHLPGDSKSRATDAKPPQGGWSSTTLRAVSTAAKGARNFWLLTESPLPWSRSGR